MQYTDRVNKMKVHWIFIFGVLFAVSCSTYTISNKNHSDMKFSLIQSDYRLTDLNNYGCEKIDSSVIKHILQTGTLITEREVHDYYSTTGCSIKGSIVVNGSDTGFTFDYGGVLYFKNGMILGCGRKCCSNNYFYCSWDAQNLKGL